MFHRQEDQTRFIEHLTYLLSLHRNGKSRRWDWQEMVKLLKQSGHWKKKCSLTSQQKQKLRENLMNRAFCRRCDPITPHKTYLD